MILLPNIVESKKSVSVQRKPNTSHPAGLRFQPPTMKFPRQLSRFGRRFPSLASLPEPKMPDVQKRTPTFNTLAREESFRNPQKQGSTYKILNQFVRPHIESFNALFDDSGLPTGDGDGKGLLSLGLRDIGERVVFDGTDEEGWGNRMRSRSLNSFPTAFL